MATGSGSNVPVSNAASLFSGRPGARHDGSDSHLGDQEVLIRTSSCPPRPHQKALQFRHPRETALHRRLRLHSSYSSAHPIQSRARMCFGASGSELFLADIKRADGRARVHFLRSLMRGEATNERRLVETSAVPVAMINGADDPIVRRKYIEHLDYAAIWRDTCHTIPGAAHAPSSNSRRRSTGCCTSSCATSPSGRSWVISTKHLVWPVEGQCCQRRGRDEQGRLFLYLASAAADVAISPQLLIFGYRRVSCSCCVGPSPAHP